MQTHDDDLDPKRQPLYRPTPTNPFVKWWWRTCWLCRNPAYGLMHNHFGVTTAQKLSVVVGTRVWKSGQPGIEKRIVPRHRGVQVRGNISVLGIKINVYLGWKLVRKDADGKRMLAIGVKLGWL
ncbi:hypothetical protein KDA14_05960 [Candidatus Saccharibacteria bacterium]|nr:hypothetical protein [Candidatus Saccharibacteria bacterium]